MFVIGILCGGGEDSPQGELNLPNLAGTLGNSAFRGCAKLTSVTSLGSITSIGSSAFENCTSLAAINFPSTITSVGANAFNNTAWYNSQPNGPVYIEKVLYKCKNASGDIVIPNNIVSISVGAFYDCINLTSVTIGSDVASIGVGEGVFNGCTALSTIVVDSSNATYDSRDNCNAIIETSSSTLIAGCKNTVIPNSVTKIGGYAFYNTKITAVNLPNVQNVGERAFAKCTMLTTATVKVTGSRMFSDCSSLTSITILSGCTNLAFECFAGCPFTSINIPDSVTSIASNAFLNCRLLSSITLPVNVSTIGDLAFYKCSSLTSVTIPNSVMSIGVSAFRGCTSLTSITIPNSVTSIGNSTFSGCGAVTTIVIPDSVTTIGNDAFSFWAAQITSCEIGTGLQTVGDYGLNFTIVGSMTIKAITPPTLQGHIQFRGNGPIYVPSGSVSAYQSASGWSEYADRIQAIPT